MSFYFTEESLTANITSFWSTYMEEISRQGDLLREAEVEPLCRSLGVDFRSYRGCHYFINKNVSAVDEQLVPEVGRVNKLLNIAVPGTEYKLADFVGDVNIEE